MELGLLVSKRCCTSLWINDISYSYCFLTWGTLGSQYFQLVSLLPQHLESWPLTCWTLAFCMYFQIWLCYSTVWHFQRSQPLLVHLVPSMSMFLCSARVFPGQDVRGLGPCYYCRRGWSAPSINSLAGVLWSSACHCLLDLPVLID